MGKPTNDGNWGFPFAGGNIEIVPSVVDGDLVSVRNASAARFCVAADGRRFVRKRLQEISYDGLLAEILGWLLARELGVPVPAGAVTGEGEDLSWLSEVVMGSHWVKEKIHFVANPDDLGRMLTFDALVFNPDRHAENIMLTAGFDELDTKVVCIDAGNALIGKPKGLAGVGKETPSLDRLAPGIPAELVREGMKAAAEQAQLVPRGRLQHFVDEACFFAEEPDGEVLLGALWGRFQAAEEISESYLAKIENSP